MSQETRKYWHGFLPAERAHYYEYVHDTLSYQKIRIGEPFVEPDTGYLLIGHPFGLPGWSVPGLL